QPRRAAPGTGRHAEVTRAEPGPPGLQELAELGPPSCTGSPAFTVARLLGRPQRPVLLCWSALCRSAPCFVRDQGLFPSRNLPQSNLAVTTDIPVMTPGWSSWWGVRRHGGPRGGMVLETGTRHGPTVPG